MISRRTFGKIAFVSTTGALLPNNPSLAIEPIKRTGKALIKLSLAAYSFRKYLEFKGTNKPTMSLDQFAEYASEQGLGAIEPTSYYFPDTSKEFFPKYKAFCTKLGLDISGSAVGNNFCIPDAAKLKEQMSSVNEWIERCSILGCKTIRIFAGTVAKGDTEDKAKERCINAIGQACDYAAKFGVILALENHGGITASVEQILSIVKAINHPYFGVNLDTGNFHTADPYGDLAKLAPYAVTAQIKTEIQKAGQKKEDADLKKLVEILKSVNYRGYMALEYEANEEPKTGVPKALEELKKLLS
ncbi:MAG: sugar phosphate isomerase/epimerase [Planctomycetes bacterium]|nr:sugar phosphate isomerase/epimerase [Planctomycetota bacterium]NBY01223.1 sugar phosphate isomerase/epimerase [Planctomycetota bacterium]